MYVYVFQIHDKWEDIDDDEDGETAGGVDKHITELYEDDENCELVVEALNSQEIENITMNRDM